MRCRECAAEVAVTARVCPRCGAPIVGQGASIAGPPPGMADAVVAETVTDTMVGTISDTAGKAVAAGVAGQTPPEPYVPGSGDSLPAELRLVLDGFAGLACGLFVGVLACAVATAFFVFFMFNDPDAAISVLWLFLALFACCACIGGLPGAFKVFQARVQFSRLLQRPSDPRTATVTASKHGGRTLVLDTNPGGYKPQSEVRLALRTKAEMLMPGERVTVYGRPILKEPLLVSSAQRGRAFLGTETSRSTASPGPLDEKVSGATLVNWAAWAASTTFSSTGLKSGYNKQEVEVFRSAVRDTFLGGAVFWVSTPPVRSDDLRGKQFSTHRPGYDKNEVDAFLEATGVRLAAMESTDRPVGPLVNSAILARWAEWANTTTFSDGGYTAGEVDAFRRAIRDTFRGVREPLVTSDDVHGKQFTSTENQFGYDKRQVAAFLDAAGIRLAAMESTDRPPEEPLVSGTILTDGPNGQTQQDFQPPRWGEWAEWADSTRFPPTRKRWGYDTAEVDAFRQEIRDTFLGFKQPPLTSDEANDKRFRLTRRGYDVQQVDTFCDEAEQRLAAMRPTSRGPCD